MNLQASIDINCVIVKEGVEYCVKSENKSKNLGCKPSKSGAKKRLQQVEYFKHLKAGGPGSGRHPQGISRKANQRVKRWTGKDLVNQRTGKKYNIVGQPKLPHNKVLAKHGFEFEDTNHLGNSRFKNSDLDVVKVNRDGSWNHFATPAWNSKEKSNASGKDHKDLEKRLNKFYK